MSRGIAPSKDNIWLSSGCTNTNVTKPGAGTLSSSGRKPALAKSRRASVALHSRTVIRGLGRLHWVISLNPFSANEFDFLYRMRRVVASGEGLVDDRNSPEGGHCW